MGLIKPVKVSAGSGDGTSIYTDEIYTQGGHGVPVTVSEPDEQGRKCLTIDAWMNTAPSDIVSGKKVVTNEGIVDGTHVCASGGGNDYTALVTVKNMNNTATPISVTPGYLYTAAVIPSDGNPITTWTIGVALDDGTLEPVMGGETGLYLADIEGFIYVGSMTGNATVLVSKVKQPSE